MILMGSDHRNVMATFVMGPKKKQRNSRKDNRGKQKDNEVKVNKGETDKSTDTFEDRYQNLEEKTKMEAEAAKSNRKQDNNERTTEEMNPDAKAQKTIQIKKEAAAKEERRHDRTTSSPKCDEKVGR